MILVGFPPPFPRCCRWIEVLSTATSLAEELTGAATAVEEEEEEEEEGAGPAEEEVEATTNGGDHYQ